MEEDLKPIIVDGVNVSKCEFLTKTRHCKAQMSIMGTDTNKCGCFPNCHYKQLKRKEQEEYGTLKLLKNCFDKASRLQERNEKLTDEYEAVKQCNESLMQALEDVRKEKELLKKQVCDLRPELKRLINKICRKYDIEAKTYHEKIVEIIHSLDDYKQALDNIEEILKQGVKIHDDIIVSKQILQKARKVENGR